MRKLTVLLLGLLCIGFAVNSIAEDDGMWPGGVYKSDVPTPESILGYKLGTQHTLHRVVGDYIKAVAAASDRVTYKVIGKTFQGRPQYHVIISSPENLARLDEIKASIKSLAYPGAAGNAEALEATIRNTPAIAMLNYSVHGNEASGVEASLRTIYQLAAGTDEVTENILENVVTVIDPNQNPDGHDRYVNFVNGYLVEDVNPDTQTYEHQEPWPGGRTNAYYFDLNRDWFLLTQVESRNRIRELLDWMPQVSPDLHEMGTNATYYFAPPMKPLNKIIPDVTRKWWEIYGQANASAFDRFGWTYYTRESFDYFYSGYGGSLPTMLGSIAMTYEQASARGRVSERRDGTLLTLLDGIRHHFTTSMATLKTTAERREERLRDFHDFFVEMIKRGGEGDVREFYIPPADPVRFNKLINRIQAVGGTVYLASSEFTVKNAYDYFTGKTAGVKLPSGTAIIPLNQMAYAAILTILEHDSPLDEEFLNEERERFRRNQPSRFYDITAWSLPLTYGIQAYWSGSRTSVDKVEAKEMTDINPPASPVSEAKVAYLIPPDTNANIGLLIKLLGADYRVRVARLAFSIGDREFPPGTAVLRVGRNPKSLHEDINKFAAATGGYAVATDTGYTPEGIDLGSNNVLAMRKPKVAVLADRPASSYSFGTIRYIFEQIYDMPYSALNSRGLGQYDLSKYNVLIMPSAYSFGGFNYQSIVGERGITNLKDWVRKGGVLICIGGAVNFAIDEKVGFSKAPKYSQRRKEAGEVEEPYASSPTESEEEDAEEKKDKSEKKEYKVDKLFRTPGAILKVRLDDRSFLSWGYADGFASVLVNSSSVYEPISDDQGMTAGRYYAENEMVISGHVWPEMKKLLAGKAYAWYERFGRGQVICFSEDLLFRASYDGLERLFFNAVLFSLAFAP